MSTIQDESLNGTLDASKLSNYLAGDPSIIDRVGGSKDLTPLAAACSRGHLSIVRLLLGQKANPDAPSPHGRTPFYFAASPPIVQALITGGAKIDLPCDDDGNTPLMNAIVQFKDKDIVRLLVDNKASLTQKNSRGETADDLAKKIGMAQYLRPKGDRNTLRAQVVDTILKMVLLILAYANTLTGGLVNKLFGIKGVKDEDLAKVLIYLTRWFTLQLLTHLHLGNTRTKDGRRLQTQSEQLHQGENIREVFRPQ
jgi:hypothetical protein